METVREDGANHRRAEAEVLERAAGLRARFARAASIARANGLGYAIFGALTIATSMTADVVATALGIALLTIGVRERQAGWKLGAGDAAAPARLARGEIALFFAIAAYCAFQLVRPAAEISADLEMLGETAGMDAAEMVNAMRGIVYSAVALTSFVYQGAMALYFRRRQDAVDRYLRETPDWARDVLASI
jgi:hypothetical protein